MLTPNLESLAKDMNDDTSIPGSEDDHVMSFMQYDVAKDSELPADRSSWGWMSSTTGSASGTTNEDTRVSREKETRGVDLDL